MRSYKKAMYFQGDICLISLKNELNIYILSPHVITAQYISGGII